MSTPATIEFKGILDSATIYCHWDGYPHAMHEKLNKALMLAWELPRFEPDEFAAAFVAMNKVSPGGYRIIKSHKNYDKSYHYVITLSEAGNDTELHVKCYKVVYETGKLLLFKSGTLSEMATWNNV